MTKKILFPVPLLLSLVLLAACDFFGSNNGDLPTKLPGTEIPIPKSWDTGTTPSNMERLWYPEVYPIMAPVAGNYPQGLYKYPYRAGSGSFTDASFDTTLEWYPKIDKTFATNTEYVAVITLEPKNSAWTFMGLEKRDLRGNITTDTNIKDITSEIKDHSLVLYVIYEKTGAAKAAPQLVFEDNFDGTEIDQAKWDTPTDPTRGGRGYWDPDMVSVAGGNLRIGIRRENSLGANWIRSGALQTKRASGGSYSAYVGPTIFEHSYGYYESRIKFPVARGTWGAFWLMTTSMEASTPYGYGGTEIDIIESIHNQDGMYNSALHWDGYGNRHKKTGFEALGPNRINIYDGEFHTFALCWSPGLYIFYVDDVEFWRVSDDVPNEINRGGNLYWDTVGVAHNPNFIILSVECADWAGSLPGDFADGAEREMLVDYVRVWNQPRN